MRFIKFCNDRWEVSMAVKNGSKVRRRSSGHSVDREEVRDGGDEVATRARLS